MENHGGTGTTDICSASSGRNYACRLIMHESIGLCKRCPICAHCTSDAHIRERSGAIHACSDQSCARICAPRGRGVRHFRVSKIRLCSLDLFVARSYPGVGNLKVSATEVGTQVVIYTTLKLGLSTPSGTPGCGLRGTATGVGCMGRDQATPGSH